MLESYLCGVRADLNRDSAIANLILRNEDFLADMPRSFMDRYVPSGLKCILRTFEMKSLPVFSPGLLGETFSIDKVTQVIENAKFLVELIPYARIWMPDVPATDLKQLSDELITFQRAILAAWRSASRKRPKRHYKHGGYEESEDSDSVSTKLSVSTEFGSQYGVLVVKLNTLFGVLPTLTAEATEFGSRNHPSPMVAISKPEYLKYCRIADVARALPNVVCPGNVYATFPLLDTVITQNESSLLLVAPAGYGKTSFCKWRALKDAQNMLDRRSDVLPIVIPLHSLANEALENIESTFFRSSDLQKLIKSPSSSQSRIRLYLDGLDEVPSKTQARLVSLARLTTKRMPHVQIILTARDHVIGPWLGWLPRIYLSELDSGQIQKLVSNWLQDSGRGAKGFFEELKNHSPLAPLMPVPLLGTLILCVYRKTATLPPNKARLYAMFVQLLSGGWDLAKDIKRETKFGSEVKLIILTRFASLLHLRGQRDGSERDLRIAIDSTLGGFASRWKPFLAELIDDGLLIRVGDQLCFAHLSFQEYLTATDLSDPTGQRPRQALALFLGGNDWWKEVLMFFVALSKRPIEMDDWLIRNARSTNGQQLAHLEARLAVLRQALSEAHPGYRAPFKGQSVLELSRDLRLTPGRESELTDEQPWRRDTVSYEWSLVDERLAPEEEE